MKCIFKIITLLLLLSTLGGCGIAPPLPEPYVAIKGKPYYWHPKEYNIYDCTIREWVPEGEKTGYKTRFHGCGIIHDGNFSQTDLKDVWFFLSGTVYVSYLIPKPGIFFASSHGYEERRYQLKIKVLDEDDPALAKCERIDYQKLKDERYHEEEYAQNAVAYDCSR